MVATNACDDTDWAKDALLNPHLAAAVILSFRQRRRVDPDAVDDTMPSTSAPTRPMEWGRKIKRSRMMKIPRIFSTMREEEEETAKVAAADEEEEQLGKKKGKRQPSPQSPLEGYSSASASGGEERSRAGRPTGVSIAEVEVLEEHRVKMVAATNLCEPKSSTNPASCHARRPSSKKMKKVELQAVQVFLLEEKANLLEEMENWRRTLEQLRVDNNKLQLLFKFAKQPKTIQQTAGKRRPISPPSSSHPRSKDFIQLPDLNEPLPDC